MSAGPPGNRIQPREGLLCYCRAGFEGALAAELLERAGTDGAPVHVQARPASAHVLLLGAGDSRQTSAALPLREFVFARQKLALIAELDELDPADRITPLIAALPPRRWGELWVEHPDSADGRTLAGLARAFANALRPALRAAGRLTPRDNAAVPRLHVMLRSGTALLLAEADTRDASPWRLGIPRLRTPAGTPSRAAAKLEEAFAVLLDDEQRNRWLAPGMRAADLGAAPGGWSWVLARRHIRVHAIDNAEMAPRVLDTGIVEHVRADGFRWQPPAPMDWVVCDMVEQPFRVAGRIGTWFANGWCRYALFNLKLPMSRRWEETRRCLAHLESTAGSALEIRARHLYHDREEVTVLAHRR